MSSESSRNLSRATFDRLVAFHRLSIRLQEAGDEAAILRTLDEGLAQLGLTTFVGRFDADSQTIRVFAASGGGATGQGVAPRPLSASPILERAVRGHEATFLTEGTALAGVLPIVPGGVAERRRVLRALGPTIAVPMVAHGRTSGVLFVLGQDLEEEETALLRGLADHLAVALDSAAVMRDLKQALLREHAAAQELRRLEALVGDLAAESEPESVLLRIVSASADALGVDRIALYLVEEGEPGLRLAASLGVEAEFAARLGRLPAGRPSDLLGRVLREGASAVVPDTRTDRGWASLLTASERATVRSAWFVPLVSREGDRLGVLAVFADRPGAPTPEQLELAGRYAHHAAVAIAAGRRHQRETLAARTEALVELARSLPHELGQPLAIIAGYAELIAEGMLEGEKLREGCRELVEASNNLATLIQRLERITSYASKDYGPGRTVIDFQRAIEGEPDPE